MKLNKRIEKEYGIKIKECSVIKKERNSTYVAKLVTENNQAYAVKSLRASKDKQDFITYSEWMLSNKGVPLAKPILTKNKKMSIIYNGVPYVLYEWAEGDRHPFNQLSDLRSMVQTIAHMHQASRGLEYPSKIKIQSQRNLGEEYKKRLQTFDSFYLTHKHTKNPNIREFAEAIPDFRKYAKKAIKHLKNSQYDTVAKRPCTKQTLIHGDAHPGNIRRENNRNTLIDFEDVRYDLPTKDLHRLHSKYIKRHKFDGKTFDKMMSWYEEVHPLPSKILHLVMIDFLFPHTFYRFLHLKKFNSYTKESLRHIIKQEKKKAKYILKNYFNK